MQAPWVASFVLPLYYFHNWRCALHRHILTLFHAFRGFLFLLLLLFLSVAGLGRLGRLRCFGGLIFLRRCRLRVRHGTHLTAHFSITHLVITHLATTHLATLR